MKNYERLQFQDFWSRIGSPSLYQASDLVQFSDVVGFHVYADLRLNLDLAAAQDSRDAMRCVDLLEDFTIISDRCAALAGMRILEIQGGRNHFVLPTDDPASVLPRLLQFSSALTRTVYEEIKPKAGADWEGFSMAADHGVAVLIPSQYGGGSLVSLGNCANQPAKKLGRGVDSGHLALPERIGKSLPGAKPSGEWILLNVNVPVAATQGYFEEGLLENMRRVARTVLDDRRRKVARDFALNLNEGIRFSTTPLRTRGMCLRADLDGFTPIVESAFKNRRVPELVRQFTDLMAYPLAFAQKLGRTLIEIPWAGDCCTMLIRQNGSETLEEMRASLPVEAGRHWHGLAYENGDAKRWSNSLGSAKWALGLASGDREEGGDGNAIICEFPAAGRSFRVIVGWCARRAKDAQETCGKGDDTVIPLVDYQNLEEVFKPLFRETASLYRAAAYSRLRNSGQSVSKPLAHSASQHVFGIATALPAPRPHGPRS